MRRTIWGTKGSWVGTLPVEEIGRSVIIRKRRDYLYNISSAIRLGALTQPRSPNSQPCYGGPTMPATLTGRNLIAGHWHSANGHRFESRSPARESEVLGVFPQSSADEARQAVVAA